MQPTFTTEPATVDSSISASGSDSNKNSRVSRDDKDKKYKYSEILWPDSPPKTEEIDNRYIYFLIIYNNFVMKTLASTLALVIWSTNTYFLWNWRQRTQVLVPVVLIVTEIAEMTEITKINHHRK